MKLGIMQPYFFPYIGYWQLLNAVDMYVIYDDVNYIKGGWINRNRILAGGSPHYLNLPLAGASPNKKINEIEVNKNDRLFEKGLQTLRYNYRKAPYFKDVYPVIEEAFSCRQTNLAGFITESLRLVCSYLGIETKMVVSSAIHKNNELKGMEKVLEICRILGADTYLNAIGGKELYSRDEFGKHGITLYFLKTDDIRYEQFGNPFQGNLSIIDVMMFNPVEKIREMLAQFTLIE
ncbi:hypothetical protein D3Z50_07020 [Clostridiaceae bacterium]|nr:hypothetical protein [Clostridiaceae bacterium]